MMYDHAHSVKLSVRYMGGGCGVEAANGSVLSGSVGRHHSLRGDGEGLVPSGACSSELQPLASLVPKKDSTMDVYRLALSPGLPRPKSQA